MVSNFDEKFSSSTPNLCYLRLYSLDYILLLQQQPLNHFDKIYLKHGNIAVEESGFEEIVKTTGKRELF